MRFAWRRASGPAELPARGQVFHPFHIKDLAAGIQGLLSPAAPPVWSYGRLELAMNSRRLPFHPW
jgi:hypothetical protein